MNKLLKSLFISATGLLAALMPTFASADAVQTCAALIQSRPSERIVRACSSINLAASIQAQIDTADIDPATKIKYTQLVTQAMSDAFDQLSQEVVRLTAGRGNKRNTAQSVQLSTALANATLSIGSTYQVNWTRSGQDVGVTTDATITRTPINGTSGTEASATIPNTGSYSWTISSSANPGEYSLKVCVLTYCDQQDVSIVAASTAANTNTTQSAPVIYSISPNQAANDANTIFTITGANLSGASNITLYDSLGRNTGQSSMLDSVTASSIVFHGGLLQANTAAGVYRLAVTTPVGPSNTVNITFTAPTSIVVAPTLLNHDGKYLSWSLPSTNTRAVRHWQMQRFLTATEPTSYISNCPGDIYYGSTEPANWANCNINPYYSSLNLNANQTTYNYRARAIWSPGDSSAWSNWVTVQSSAPVISQATISSFLINGQTSGTFESGSYPSLSFSGTGVSSYKLRMMCPVGVTANGNEGEYCGVVADMGQWPTSNYSVGPIINSTNSNQTITLFMSGTNSSGSEGQSVTRTIIVKPAQVTISGIKQVITGDYFDLAADSVKLGGTVEVSEPVTVGFQYGIDGGSPLKWNSDTRVMPGTGDFSINLWQLTPNTRYYYQLSAKTDNYVQGQSGGQMSGSVKSFTTLGTPTISNFSLGSNSTWTVGSQHTFTWISQNLPSDSRIHVTYFDANSQASAAYPTEITTLDPSATSYTWTLPASLVVGHSYAMRLSVITNNGVMADTEGSGQMRADRTFTVTGSTTLKTHPTITMLSLPTSTLDTGMKSLLRFKVAADSSGGVGLYKFTIKIDPRTAVLANINGYAYTDSAFQVGVNGVGSGGLLTNSPLVWNAADSQLDVYMNSANSETRSAIEIPASQNRYFEIKATCNSGCRTSGASISTQLEGDDTSVSSGATATNIDGNSNNDFIWSPNTNGSSAPTDADWLNGHSVRGLSGTYNTPAIISAYLNNQDSQIASVLAGMRATIRGLEARLQALR